MRELAVFAGEPGGWREAFGHRDGPRLRHRKAETYLSILADNLEEAEFAVLVFDYRYFGGSEGKLQGRLMPIEQHSMERQSATCRSSSFLGRREGGGVGEPRRNAAASSA